MRLKVTAFLILIFTLTGCSAQYNLTIDDKNIDENTILQFSKSQYTSDEITSYVSEKISITQEPQETEKYESTKTEDDNNYYINYNHLFSTDNFIKSYFVTKCYKNVELKKSFNTMTLSTGNLFSCIYIDDMNIPLESVQINITTKLKVNQSNADKVSGNTYTWNINKNNYTNKSINMIMETPKDNTALIKSTKETIWIYAIFIIPVIIVIVYLLWKKKKINKI